MGEFDGRWNQVNNQTKFLDNYGQLAPRQALNFDTVGRLALQYEQQQAQQQQQQQFQNPQQQNYRPQILPQTQQPQSTYQPINTSPYLQSQVIPSVQSVQPIQPMQSYPAITTGPNRVSSVSNTGNTINSLSNKYQTRN